MTRRQTNIRQRVQSCDRQVQSPGSSNVTDTRERQPASQLPQSGREAALTACPRLLRFPDVRNRTGLSRSTIWRLERDGCFPRHRRISANAVAWPEDEVLAWIRVKITT
jgi:prophage regulatory protein